MATTAADIIAIVDERNPNQVSEDTKLKWLAQTEQKIYNTVVLRCTGAEEITPMEYESDMSAQTTSLIIPEPYTDVYVYAIEMHIHETNGDIDRYNNSRIQFEDALNDFDKYWIRTHRPKPWPRFRL